MELIFKISVALLVASAMLISVSYCGQYNREARKERLSKTTTGRAECCINGVIYYNGMGGSFAPAFKPDGSLFLCKE